MERLESSLVYELGNEDVVQNNNKSFIVKLSSLAKSTPHKDLRIIITITIVIII